MDIIASSRHTLGADWTGFDAFFRRALHSEIELLHTINQHLLQHSGKQLRPLLALMAGRLCGAINESTYLSATAVEMVHTASLLHDDVVDNADQRRGAPSVKAVWKSNAAVLTGDYWLARAFQLVVQHEEHRLLPWFTNCLIDLSEGELLQLSKARTLNTTEKDYYTIIGKKTASLLAVSMATGAITAGATEERAQQMYAIGYQLGLAFQIRDDIFDYNKTNLLGKPTGNDLREQKITLPLLYALEQADAKTREEVLGWVKKAAKDSAYVSRVNRFVKAQQGIERAQATLQTHTQKAVAIIREFPEGAIREQLIQLATFLAERKK